MTDQELIQALQMCSKIRCPDCLKEHTVCYRRKWMADASTRLETLRAEKQLCWIPVTERLPDHNKSVLVYCENFTIQGGYTVHIGSCDRLSGTPFWFLRTQPGVSSFPNHEWRVTHWMPLPEPPKEVRHGLK